MAERPQGPCWLELEPGRRNSPAAGRTPRLLCSGRAGPRAGGASGVLGRSSGRGDPSPKSKRAKAERQSRISRRGAVKRRRLRPPELPDPTRFHLPGSSRPRQGMDPPGPRLLPGPRRAPRHPPKQLLLSGSPPPAPSSIPNNPPKAQQHPLIPHRERSQRPRPSHSQCPLTVPNRPDSAGSHPRAGPRPGTELPHGIRARAGPPSRCRCWCGVPISVQDTPFQYWAPSQQRRWNGTSHPRTGHPTSQSVSRDRSLTPPPDHTP